jgi:hypothetical protein
MGSYEDIRTDFLFAQPGFLFGLARFFDFSGTFDRYNASRTESEADARATLADWHLTGADLCYALNVAQQDPSACCDESQQQQLSLFHVSAEPGITREFQKTA